MPIAFAIGISCEQRLFVVNVQLKLLCNFLLVAFKQVIDTLYGTEKLADGCVMVKGIDDICNVFAHIYLAVPLSCEKLGSAIYKVCGEDSVKESILISLVELCKTVCKQTECFKNKYSLCTLFLYLE